MGYPARSHHNSFLFILKTMNFGTMNLNFRTLHSCMLAKRRVRQGDGDKARTLACVSVKEVAGRFLIMSNKNPKRHQASGLSCHPPCLSGSRRLGEEPSATQPHPSPPVSPGHGWLQSFSLQREQHPQASPQGSSGCLHHTAASQSRGPLLMQNRPEHP